MPKNSYIVDREFKEALVAYRTKIEDIEELISRYRATLKAYLTSNMFVGASAERLGEFCDLVDESLSGNYFELYENQKLNIRTFIEKTAKDDDI